LHGFLDKSGIFTLIDFPGATATNATGINNAGQIVGVFSTASVSQTGFLDSGGVFTTIEVPGATSTWATGINDAGQIVGIFSNGSGEHGFLDTDGVFTVIDFPGATGTSAVSIPFGINDAGQIVGNFSVGGVVHGFVATPVPEPSSLFLVGFAGLVIVWRSRFRNVGKGADPVPIHK
jgi:probable HAF family extracellular repeat protein